MAQFSLVNSYSLPRTVGSTLGAKLVFTQVAMCSKSVVYGTKKLKGGKEQVKVRAVRESSQHQPLRNMGYSYTYDTY